MKDSITRLEAIFNSAKELHTPEQREVYLRDACKGAPDLRSQVEALIRASQESVDAFKTKPYQGETILGQGDIAEGPGSSIGRYKLLQKIGEGGMGAVFMAEQTEPVRRKVALKIIKLGMDTKSVVARFEAERQALALMDHPNIAKVLDAGATETGRPYFVMELVKGVPISTYCDKNQLPTRDRLELFTQVCKSIQHAHQKGVIHRDIKPSNILVTLHDGKPVPKVIDFGIAKATNQRLTEKTLFTNFAQMIGTPAYMSPEQAEMSGLDIDTRTDVYSLGVLLYELLTGTTPFPEKELLSKGYGEMQRIIAEQEPERPSLRMSTLMGEQQSFVTKSRAGDLPLLTKQLTGDLDWIIMKALEKNRTRRYETANGLAEDILRHIENEPVTAAKPSLRYQLAKLYRRRKTVVTASLAVAGILVVATGISAWSAILAHRAKGTEKAMREKAEAMTETAETLNEFVFHELMALGDPAKSAQRSLTLFEALERLEGRIGESFAGRPELEIEARMAIGRSYLFRFDYHRSQPQLERALELSREHYGEAAPETLEACQAYLFGFLGVSHWSTNWAGTVKLLYDQSRQLYDADDPRHYRGHAFKAYGIASGVLSLSANVEANQAAYVEYMEEPWRFRSEAMELMQGPLRLHEEIRSQDPLAAALNLNLLGLLHEMRGDVSQAEDYWRRSVGEFEAYGGKTFPLALWTRGYLGRLAKDNREIEKAVREFELILELGPDIFMDSEFLTGVSQDLIKLYFYTGEKKKAASLGQQVLAEGASEFDLEKFLVTQAYGSVQSMSHQEARESRAWERVLKDLQSIPVESGMDKIPFLIANCYYHLGDIEANYAALTKLPLDATIYYDSGADFAPFLLSLRAKNRVRAGDWLEAKKEIDLALARQPDFAKALVVAAQINLHLNDTQAWARHCSSLIAQFDQLEELHKLWTLFSCLGQRDRLPDELRFKALKVAETTYATEPAHESARDRSTRILLGGLAAWSESRFEEAIDRLTAQPYQDAQRPIEHGYNWERHQWRREAAQQLLLANCHARLGRAAEAQQHLNQSNEILERISYDWWEPLLLKGLQAETAATLKGIRE